MLRHQPVGRDSNYATLDDTNSGHLQRYPGRVTLQGPTFPAYRAASGDQHTGMLTHQDGIPTRSCSGLQQERHFNDVDVYVSPGIVRTAEVVYSGLFLSSMSGQVLRTAG